MLSLLANRTLDDVIAEVPDVMVNTESVWAWRELVELMAELSLLHGGVWKTMFRIGPVGSTLLVPSLCLHMPMYDKCT